jgi:hypothetical protein
MNKFEKGIALGTLQCVLVLSLAGQLLYDRATCPRVWVRTVRRDPELPIRGRYLALELMPGAGDPYFKKLDHQQVVYFVPERLTRVEQMSGDPIASEIWAEVTLPKEGPPRPIRLGIKLAGQVAPQEVQ